MTRIGAALKALVITVAVLLSLPLGADCAVARSGPVPVAALSADSAPAAEPQGADDLDPHPVHVQLRRAGRAQSSTPTPVARTVCACGCSAADIPAPAPCPASLPYGTAPSSPSRSGELPVCLQVFRC